MQANLRINTVPELSSFSINILVLMETLPSTARRARRKRKRNRNRREKRECLFIILSSTIERGDEL